MSLLLSANAATKPRLPLAVERALRWRSRRLRRDRQTLRGAEPGGR